MAEASQRPRRSKWRAFFIILAGLIVVLGLGIAALVVAPPVALVRAQLETFVENATGREFEVAGDVKLSVYPPALVLEDVTLAAPPDAAGPALVRAERIAGEIDPLPLLQGRVEIARLEIVRPVLTVRPEDRSLLDRISQSGTGGGVGLEADQVVFRELVITDGSINYLVTQPNPTWRIDQVSATFAESAGGESKGSGSFRWRDETVTFTSALADARAYGRGEPSPVSIKASVKNLSAELNGELVPKDNPHVKGTLVASAASLRELALWLDADPGAHALKGPASLEGPIVASADQIGLAKASVKLDAGESVWDTLIRLGGAKPQVTGNIAWKSLDLQKLLGETPKMPAIALQARSSGGGMTIPSAWDGLADQLAALNAAGPGAAASALATASTARPGRGSWSVETFDLDALTAINLNLTTAADMVTHGSVAMRDVRADLLLHDGRLTYTLKQAGIDKGRATGRVDVDATAKPAKVALSLSASDVPAETVLSQIASDPILTGAAKLDVVVAGQGRNAQEILKTLDGKLAMTVEKGRLIGFNLRRALLEWWRGWSYDPSQRTAFDRISGNYGISDGVVRTVGDLSLTGPEIEITSSGTISLPAQTLDQRVRLKAFPPPQHLAVPLRVGGTWDRPSISWDWLSVFSNPGVSAAPASVTNAPEPPPAEVKAAIRQVLSGPHAAELSPQVREMLEALASR